MMNHDFIIALIVMHCNSSVSNIGDFQGNFLGWPNIITAKNERLDLIISIFSNKNETVVESTFIFLKAYLILI